MSQLFPRTGCFSLVSQGPSICRRQNRGSPSWNQIPRPPCIRLLSFYRSREESRWSHPTLCTGSSWRAETQTSLPGCHQFCTRKTSPISRISPVPSSHLPGPHWFRAFGLLWIGNHLEHRTMIPTEEKILAGCGHRPNVLSNSSPLQETKQCQIVERFTIFTGEISVDRDK